MTARLSCELWITIYAALTQGYGGVVLSLTKNPMKFIYLSIGTVCWTVRGKSYPALVALQCVGFPG